MRFACGFCAGMVSGIWMGAGMALLVVAAVGRDILGEPVKVDVVPDRVPEAWSVTW